MRPVRVCALSAVRPDRSSPCPQFGIDKCRAEYYLYK